MAKQTRYSPWCPATVSKRHVYNGRLTLTVDWEGASEGPFTADIPTSRVKPPSTEAPRPPTTPPAYPTRIHPPQEEQSRPGSPERVLTTVAGTPLQNPQTQLRRRSATKNNSQWAPLTWSSLRRQSGPLAPPKNHPASPRARRCLRSTSSGPRSSSPDGEPWEFAHATPPNGALFM